MGRTLLRFRPLAILRHTRLEPFPDQAKYAAIGHPVLDELSRPPVAHVIEEATDVRIEHPVHLLPLQSDHERIQRLMRTAARAEPVREALEVDLINLIEDRHHGLLDDFVFQCRDAQRALSPIRKAELALLAKAGVLNWTGGKHDRRTALWRAERAGQSVGPLLENIPDEFEIDIASPLLSMTLDERLVADFFATGFTIGPHPMSYHRTAMNEAGVVRAADLKDVSDGTFVRIAGAVIARQRPGTASGFIFISAEDESGISNAVIHPKVYEQNRMTVTRGKFLVVEGILQNQDGVVSVRASSVRIMEIFGMDIRSHDFY